VSATIEYLSSLIIDEIKNEGIITANDKAPSRKEVLQAINVRL